MEGDRPLTAEMGGDGLIHMTIAGDLTGGRVELLKEDVERANALIRDEAAKQHRIFDTVVDITGFTGKYDPNVLLVFGAFEKENTPHVRKTAVFGNAPTAKAIVEMTSAFSGRSNIRFFSTRDEALEWLAA